MVASGSADSNMGPIMKITSYIESKHFARLTFGHKYVYYDNNARPHTAPTVVNFMETERIEHMEWPAVSPDINRIQNMLAEVTRTMDASASQPTNMAELQQTIIDAWQALHLQTPATLIDSMPRQVQALYDARGGHTKYLIVIHVPH